MKEFKIEQDVVNGEIKEFAVFADGSRKKLIHTDDRYGKYFEVDNELNNDVDNILKYSFTGRVRDAYETIKQGNGDSLITYNIFGRREAVIYFIDRKIGEEYRKKTLDGWKDTKFGWSIECGNKNSFSGFAKLNKKSERVSVFDEDRTPITFESKDEAESYIAYLISTAKTYAKTLAIKAESMGDGDDLVNCIDEIRTEIMEYTGSGLSIIQDFVFDMLTKDCKLKTPECNLDEMGYRIVQCVIA